MKSQKKKAWGGRFKKEIDPEMESFNSSISFDKKLFAEDIDGSLAHAKILHKIGILNEDELDQIKKGLLEIKGEIGSGRFVLDPSDEDIHMAIESRLTKKIGPLGGKLHTGRSRNDQVALDLRLYAKKELQELLQATAGLQKVFVDLAEKKGLVPMPGYTHLQRAQAVLLAHHWLAYFEMLERDKGRLKDAAGRLDVSPLGSGALAGASFPLDREMVAKELGFSEISHNSLDAVSDRDFAAEILFNLSLLMIHLSRLAEELILWSTQEFGFISLPQEFCTGSSMMPQKVNPDACELIRGKSGRVVGDLMALLTVLKGLPLAYNKDLQEDKEPLFDALDTTKNCLAVLTKMLPAVEVHAEKMHQATLDGFLLATDVADYLVSKGIEFRSAHEIVGKIVKNCLEKKTTLEKLPLEDFRKFSPAFDKDVMDWLDLEKSINRRNSIGGTATVRVKEEISRAKKILASSAR